VQATISSLASPDSETVPNQLVLVAHGIGGDLERLADLKVSEYTVGLIVTILVTKYSSQSCQTTS
jgi:hypothetical protein